MKLNRAFIDLVSPCICMAFQYLESKISSRVEMAGEPMSNEAAIDGVLDDDGEWLSESLKALISEAIQNYGYPKVLRYLSKHIALYP